MTKIGDLYCKSPILDLNSLAYFLKQVRRDSICLPTAQERLTLT